jgi:hypothetical protein
MQTNSHTGDKEAVRVLIDQFADTVTRMDSEGFVKLWVSGGQWQIGEPFPLNVKGQSEIKELFVSLVCKWSFFAQLVHSVVIDVDGDNASARCICEELGLNNEAGKSYHNVALYLDELQRTAEGWRFSKPSNIPR